MRKKRRLVVLGIMGQERVAGAAWEALHYLEGFRRLGYDVYYVEDTYDWPYDPEQGTITDDRTVDCIARFMGWYGLPDRWAYRSGATGCTFGLSESQFSRLFQEADALVNLTGSTILCDAHLRVPVRIYLETDPVVPQIKVAQGCQSTIDRLSAHTHHFTFGENLGAPDCGVPLGQFDCRPARTWEPLVPNHRSLHDYCQLAAVQQRR